MSVCGVVAASLRERKRRLTTALTEKTKRGQFKYKPEGGKGGGKNWAPELLSRPEKKERITTQRLKEKKRPSIICCHPIQEMKGERIFELPFDRGKGGRGGGRSRKGKAGKGKKKKTPTIILSQKLDDLVGAVERGKEKSNTPT